MSLVIMTTNDASGQWLRTRTGPRVDSRRWGSGRRRWGVGSGGSLRAVNDVPAFLRPAMRRCCKSDGGLARRRAASRAEDVFQIQDESWQQGRAQRLSPAQGLRNHQRADVWTMNPHGFGRRIDQPVLRHAVLRVERALVAPAALGGGRREDLDDEVERAPHVLAVVQQMGRGRGRRTAGPAARRRYPRTPRRTGRRKTAAARSPPRTGPAARPTGPEPPGASGSAPGPHQIPIDRLVGLVRRGRPVVSVGKLNDGLPSRRALRLSVVPLPAGSEMIVR